MTEATENKVNTDGTENFITTSSDMPEQSAPEVVQGEQASTDESTTADSKTDDADTNQSGGTASDDKEGTGDSSAESKSAEATSDDSQEKPKPKRSAQKRIDKVVRQREEANRKNEELQRKIDDLEGKTKAEKLGLAEPDEDAFDNYDDYLAATDKYDRDKFKAEQDGKESKVEPKGNEAESGSTQDVQLTDSQKSAIAVMQERIESAENKPDDFAEIALNNDVHITGEMLEALVECDNPIEVMYHLGNNRDLSKEIAGKTAAQQMREIARLDLVKKETPIKPVSTTKAPDPISPGGNSFSGEKSIEDMSFAEFEAHQNRKGRANSSW